MDIPKVKIGDWVAISAEGKWYWHTDGTVSFKRKRDAIEFVDNNYNNNCYPESKSRVEVIRMDVGDYWYTIKEFGTSEFTSVCRVIRLTDENVDMYQEYLNKWYIIDMEKIKGNR